MSIEIGDSCKLKNIFLNHQTDATAMASFDRRSIDVNRCVLNWRPPIASTGAGCLLRCTLLSGPWKTLRYSLIFTCTNSATRTQLINNGQFHFESILSQLQLAAAHNVAHGRHEALPVSLESGNLTSIHRSHHLRRPFSARFRPIFHPSVQCV